MAKWTRHHERQREKILELMEREARPFSDMSDEAQQRRRNLPLVDPDAETDWCRTYMPHYFDKPFCAEHKTMVDMAGESGMPTFIAAFRGFGKSVLLSQARPLHRMVNREIPYIIFGALVQKLAAQMMDFVRLELEKNQRIKADYGDIRVDGSENEWIVDLGKKRDEKGRYSFRQVKAKAFGIGQDPRGERFAQHRPWEFVGDDLESQELARNPEREKKLWEWLYDSVLPGLSRENQYMTVVGTLFGPGCMMDRAKEASETTDPDGRPLARHIRIPAMHNGEPTWPEGAPAKQLMRIRAMVGLKSWNRNYVLISKDPDKPFQDDWLEEYDAEELDTGQLEVVTFLDPAISQSSDGCPRAWVCVGASRKTGHRYVLDARIDRATPKQMLDWVIDGHRNWKPKINGIEINGGYALLKPMLDDRRGGQWLPVTYIPQTEAKETRIERLSPQMEAGRWYFPQNPHKGVRALIDQLLSYPDGWVDGPDALAGCDAMLPDVWRPQEKDFQYSTASKRTDFRKVM